MARGIAVDGATVLLTGASSGIGRATARELARAGARMAVVARRRELLDKLAADLAREGCRPLHAITADLAVRGVARDVAAQARRALGDVDILVNNAGGGVGGAQFAVADGDAGREAFEVNYWTPLALIGEFVPAMRARGRGAVVNVTSLAQVAAWPGFGSYAATKAALALSTRTLRTELHGSGVSVLEVVPGPVDTAVQGETRLIPGIERMLDTTPLGSAEELARLIVRALRRGSPRLVYPRRSRLGYALPGLAQWYSHRLATRTLSGLDAATRESVLAMVVRSGSMGDEVAREARAQWERAHAR